MDWITIVWYFRIGVVMWVRMLVMWDEVQQSGVTQFWSVRVQRRLSKPVVEDRVQDELAALWESAGPAQCFGKRKKRGPARWMSSNIKNHKKAIRGSQESSARTNKMVKKKCKDGAHLWKKNWMKSKRCEVDWARHKYCTWKLSIYAGTTRQ